MADLLTAANAYQNQLKLLQNSKSSAGLDDDNSTQQTSFSQMVKDAIKGSIDQEYNAEALQTQSMTGGNVDLADLVTAVSNAELTLNTVVAVRDRVISAYQDILKMPI